MTEDENQENQHEEVVQTERKIPKTLQDENFRFILLQKNSKNPVEEDWQNTNNYKFNDEKLVNHLKEGGNYGVLAGKGNLRILDIDDKSLAEQYVKEVKTYITETCGKTNHFYFISEYDENIVFEKGELRSKGMYVVGPECYAIDKKKGHEGWYKEINLANILKSNREEILKLIPKGSSITKTTDDSVFEDINIQIEVDKPYIEKYILPKLGGVTRTLIIEAMGEDKLNGMGFPSRSERDSKVITTLLLNGFGGYIKSIFKLFPIGDKYREHNDGDKYLLHTIRSGRKYSGVIDDQTILLEKELETLNERVLRNKMDDYLKKILVDKNELRQTYLLGIIAKRTMISKKDLSKRMRIVKDSSEEKNPIAITELINKDMPEIKYWMYPLIPKNSLILFGGKPGTFKSMLVLSLALSLRDTTPFLGTFSIREKPKILLYDLENGENTIWWRLKYLTKGLKIDQTKLGDFYVETKFNKENLLKELELSKNYDIIILDSYRRFLEGTENDSEITDKFFNEFLKVLMGMGKTVIIIHHFKKTKIFEELTDEDLMDMFRGSSDIPAQFDLIFGVFRGIELVKKTTDNINFDVYVTRGKNRLGLPVRNFSFNVTKNEREQATEFKFNGFKKMESPKERIKAKIVEIVRIEPEIKRNKIVEQIVEEFSCTNKAVDNYLKELVRDHELHQPKYGSYSVYAEEVPLPDDTQTRLTNSE